MKVAERKPSCLENWFPAGTIAPLYLTTSQRECCRKTLGVRRFCHNPAVATHRFDRIDWLLCPGRQDIYKSFMDLGRALANWRNPETRICIPKFLKGKFTGDGSFRAASGPLQSHDNRRWQVTVLGVGSLLPDHTLPKDIYHDAHIRLQNGRWYRCLNYWKEPEKRPQPDRLGARAFDAGINLHSTASHRQAHQNPRVHHDRQDRLRMRA